MAGHLLDTNVVSELIKPHPEPRVVEWIARRSPLDLHLSAMTIGELVRGVARLAPGRRRERLARWIEDDLARQFEGRIIAFDHEVAKIWGAIMGRCDREGQPRAAIDAQIAAAAIRHGMVLATRNETDFAGMGARIVNPWRER